ncbi:MAG: hypothetical protein R2744_07500 [Bacteroidales bacterium]
MTKSFPGKRSVTWRSDKPATLLWVEALDGGDPEKEMEYHDQVFTLEAPFTAEPAKIPGNCKKIWWYSMGE